MRKLINGATVEKNKYDIIEFCTPEKEFSVLWFGDAHIDNPKSETKFLHKTIKENPNSFIQFGGDHHDLMQWKMDKRSSYSSLNQQLKEDDYFNLVVENTKKNVLERYKDRIISFNLGNHETGITRRLNLDFTKWLLNDTGIEYGAFSGYMRFSHVGIQKKKNSKLLYYQHAPTSGGNRSKGMLSVDILAGQRPDADIFITEHIHQTWVAPLTVEKVTQDLKPTEKLLWFIQSPTLKAEYKGKRVGFYQEIVKAGTTTIGAIKLNFKLRRTEHSTRQLICEPQHILMYN